MEPEHELPDYLTEQVMNSVRTIMVRGEVTPEIQAYLERMRYYRDGAQFRRELDMTVLPWHVVDLATVGENPIVLQEDVTYEAEELLDMLGYACFARRRFATKEYLASMQLVLPEYVIACVERGAATITLVHWSKESEHFLMLAGYARKPNTLTFLHPDHQPPTQQRRIIEVQVPVDVLESEKATIEAAAKSGQTVIRMPGAQPESVALMRSHGYRPSNVPNIYLLHSTRRFSFPSCFRV
jgi:hypothetical protein